jgi:hypothetical protein
MKKINSKVLILVFLFLSIGAISQPPPPPNDPTLGSGNTPVGGGAPIGNGVFVLLALGVAYGVKKFLDLRKEAEPESESND